MIRSVLRVKFFLLPPPSSSKQGVCQDLSVSLGSESPPHLSSSQHHHFRGRQQAKALLCAHDVEGNQLLNSDNRGSSSFRLLRNSVLLSVAYVQLAQKQLLWHVGVAETCVGIVQVSDIS